ncbi:MAG: ATP-binding cassette domain-containing protein [Paludibacteraceae bacterium]|nr:ATP-binding cassette domain-containing protein [Paludibacteraceae bacterium]
MIVIENLVKKFGEQVAVNIPSLKITKGEVIGLVGNNGAGKTTLFRLILDLYQADEGFVTNKDLNVAQSEDWKIFTGAFIDSGFLIDFLKPEEYFEFLGKMHDIKKEVVKERLVDYEKFMAGEILGKKKYLRNFSAGNRQKIGIVGAMLIHPEVLILDEPFNFLDPSSQVEMKRLIQRINEQGTTVLISSHNLDYVVDASSRILLMERGQIIKDLPNTNNEAEAELKSYFEA